MRENVFDFEDLIFKRRMAATGSPKDNEGRRPDATNNNNNNNNNNDSNYDYERLDLKPYTFNGKVVIGIALVLAAAASSTILAMTVSQSPQASIPISALGVIGAAKDNNNNNIPTATAQGGQNAKPDREFILVANDFGWNGSQNGPVIRVTKGDVVQLTISNAGQMAHNFGIAKLSDRATQLMGETKDMTLPERVSQIPYSDMAKMPCPDCEKKFEQGHIEFFIKPGNQRTVTFTADEDGQFKYFCMVRGHIWLGMNGDFIVEEPAGFIVKQPAASGVTTNGGA
ncbi:MAG: plastocyanin/azurin family copper-binding protein [Thermoproteota archaeon]|nr:plastocyanin/azurin family copper-binding protein [Thermoproteota archaeon]